MALFGWKKIANNKICCELCQQERSVMVAGDEEKVEFDARQEHRSYCPWANGAHTWVTAAYGITTPVGADDTATTAKPLDHQAALRMLRTTLR